MGCPLTREQALAALEQVNARRRQDGLAPLTRFGDYTAPSAEAVSAQAALMQAGQALLERRRAELGVPPPPVYPPKAAAEGTASPSPTPFDHSAKKSAQTLVFPGWVKSWSQLTLAASRQKSGGAVRAWDLARALDPTGSGQVARADLMAFLAHLKVTRSTRCRWVREAIQRGLFRSAREGKRLVYLGVQAACLKFSVADPGERVELPAADLAQRGWKCAALAGALTRFHRPISRAALQSITGVNRRTQLNYQHKGGVRAEANYALDSRAEADQIDGYREFIRPHAFVVRYASGRQSRQGVAFRLPNTYRVPGETAKPSGGRYRSQNIRQETLAQQAPPTRRAAPAPVIASECSGSASGVGKPASRFAAGGPQGDLRAGDTNHGGPRRRYFDRYRPLKTALRRMARLGQAGAVYELLPGGIARRHRTCAHHWWQMIEG